MKLIRLHAHALACGGLAHQQSHQVVGQREHRRFLKDAFHRLAVQGIHAQGDLEVFEVGFDLPPIKVELRQRRFGIAIGVDECCDQCDLLDAKSRSLDLVSQFADNQAFRQRRELL